LRTKKTITIRDEILDRVGKLAERERRSVQGQIEVMVRRGVQERDRIANETQEHGDDHGTERS
jgi:hypothetical protein